ncbi:MAG: HAD family phosphatase [Bacteroidota bacterium]
MTTPVIDTIIFDLGGVLVDWNPRYLFQKLLPNDTAVDDFLNRVATFDWNEQQDGGRSIAAATAALVAQHPEHESLIRAYYDRWEEMLGGAKEDVVTIFRKLKESGRYNIYALTNWSAETYPIAERQFEFLQWFDGVLVSGRERLKKPDPKIYQLTLRRFNIAAKSAIFIDDNLRNVRAAEQEGIRSIHFTTSDALRNALAQYEIRV